MAEADWSESSDPRKMLARLRRRRKLDRKLYLFACACWRRVMELMTAVPNASRDSPQSRESLLAAIEALEKYSDKPSPEALGPFFRRWEYLTLGLANVGSEDASAWEVAFWAHWAAGWWVFNDAEPPQAVQEHARAIENKAQADLMRHIFGNPFQRYPAPDYWPPALVSLAQALYHGEDCRLVLHDALLEAGHAELAEHFHQEPHPRGCWVVDMVLGKE